MKAVQPWRGPCPPPEPGRGSWHRPARVKRVNVRWLCLRPPDQLEQYEEDAEASDLRPFVSLSHGIQADRAAIVNGLTLPWSTGPVEGTATRVKVIKRQGYTPASTHLL